MKINHKMLLVAALAFVIASFETSAQKYQGIIDKTVAVVGNEMVSLAQLEEDLHISKHYISHLFGDKLNIGFNDYINSLRITYAARLLRETNDPIIDVSENSGFNSLRTFNRAFKKHIGVSPRDYRNNKNAARYSENRSPSL